MSDLYQTRLQGHSVSENLSLLTRIQRGIEKEGLRGKATVAQTEHPKALGSA